MAWFVLRLLTFVLIQHAAACMYNSVCEAVPVQSIMLQAVLEGLPTHGGGCIQTCTAVVMAAVAGGGCWSALQCQGMHLCMSLVGSDCHVCCEKAVQQTASQALAGWSPVGLHVGHDCTALYRSAHHRVIRYVYNQQPGASLCKCKQLPLHAD